MAHPDGEIATAKACANVSDTPMALSTFATSSIEQVASAAPSVPKIYQVYLSRYKDVNIDIWKRLRENGYKGIAVTTDSQLLGKRYTDVRLSFSL